MAMGIFFLRVGTWLGSEYAVYRMAKPCTLRNA